MKNQQRIQSRIKDLLDLNNSEVTFNNDHYLVIKGEKVTGENKEGKNPEQYLVDLCIKNEICQSEIVTGKFTTK